MSPWACVICGKQTDRWYEQPVCREHGELHEKLAELKKENEELRDEISECVSSAIELDVVTVHDVNKGGEESKAKSKGDCQCTRDGCGCCHDI